MDAAQARHLHGASWQRRGPCAVLGVTGRGGQVAVERVGEAGAEPVGGSPTSVTVAAGGDGRDAGDTALLAATVADLTTRLQRAALGSYGPSVSTTGSAPDSGEGSTVNGPEPPPGSSATGVVPGRIQSLRKRFEVLTVPTLATSASGGRAMVGARAGAALSPRPSPLEAAPTSAGLSTASADTLVSLEAVMSSLLDVAPADHGALVRQLLLVPELVPQQPVAAAVLVRTLEGLQGGGHAAQAEALWAQYVDAALERLARDTADGTSVGGPMALLAHALHLHAQYDARVRVHSRYDVSSLDGRARLGECSVPRLGLAGSLERAETLVQAAHVAVCKVVHAQLAPGVVRALMDTTNTAPASAGTALPEPLRAIANPVAAAVRWASVLGVPTSVARAQLRQWLAFLDALAFNALLTRKPLSVRAPATASANVAAWDAWLGHHLAQSRSDPIWGRHWEESSLGCVTHQGTHTLMHTCTITASGRAPSTGRAPSLPEAPWSVP
jgi:hypothetical protein